MLTIGGIVVGHLLERNSQRYGPYLVFQSDGSVRFPRLKKTIVPNETTLVEILPTDLRQHGKSAANMTDLIVLYEDESYYVITGLNHGVFDSGDIKRMQKEIVDAIRTHCTSEKDHEPK